MSETGRLIEVRDFKRVRSPYRPHDSDRVFAKLRLRGMARLLESNADLSWRVWGAGLLRMQSNGHAPFRPGELRAELANRETGAMPTRQGVRAAIGRLVAAGALGAPSGLACLLYPIDLLELGLGSGEQCPECRTDEAWHRDDGWVSSAVYKQRAQWFQRAPRSSANADR